MPVTFLNDQFQEVGVLVEVSVNWTISGEVPLVTSVVKLATGDIPAGFTMIVVPGLVVWLPSVLATVSRAV